MAITIDTLLTRYQSIMPVSTAEGVSNAMTWIALTHDFSLTVDETTLANRDLCISLCEQYFKLMDINSDDYNTVNDNMKHIRDLLQAQHELNTN